MLWECFPAALDVCMTHLSALLIRPQMVKHFVFCLWERNALLSKRTVCVLLPHYSCSFCPSFLFSFSLHTFVSTFQSLLLLLDITVFSSPFTASAPSFCFWHACLHFLYSPFAPFCLLLYIFLVHLMSFICGIGENMNLITSSQHLFFFFSACFHLYFFFFLPSAPSFYSNTNLLL